MITGRDYFKSLGGEYEEEKIFSTGNDELDALLEEVYFSGISDGYDYAQKEFAEKKVELKTGDAINYYGNYGLMRKNGLMAKMERDRISGDTKSNLRNTSISGGAGGAVAGGIIGGLQGGTKGALIGAPVGAAIGAGASALGTAAGLGLRHSMENGEGEKAKNYKKSWEKQSDLLDLKQGKMSKEEFVKKWGGKIDGKKIKGSKNKD